MKQNKELQDLHNLLTFEIRMTKKMLGKAKKENNFKDCLEHQASIETYVFVRDEVSNLIKTGTLSD